MTKFLSTTLKVLQRTSVPLASPLCRARLEFAIGAPEAAFLSSRTRIPIPQKCSSLAYLWMVGEINETWSTSSWCHVSVLALFRIHGVISKAQTRLYNLLLPRFDAFVVTISCPSPVKKGAKGSRFGDYSNFGSQSMFTHFLPLGPLWMRARTLCRKLSARWSFFSSKPLLRSSNFSYSLSCLRDTFSMGFCVWNLFLS